jgi:hypothetical protein
MCIARHDMRTNIVLDDDLAEEAYKEYVAKHKMKNLQDLRGKIQFNDDYNYKDMRIDS